MVRSIKKGGSSRDRAKALGNLKNAKETKPTNNIQGKNTIRSGPGPTGIPENPMERTNDLNQLILDALVIDSNRKPRKKFQARTKGPNLVNNPNKPSSSLTPNQEQGMVFGNYGSEILSKLVFGNKLKEWLTPASKPPDPAPNDATKISGNSDSQVMEIENRVVNPGDASALLGSTEANLAIEETSRESQEVQRSGIVSAEDTKMALLENSSKTS